MRARWTAQAGWAAMTANGPKRARGSPPRRAPCPSMFKAESSLPPHPVRPRCLLSLNREFLRLEIESNTSCTYSKLHAHGCQRQPTFAAAVQGAVVARTGRTGTAKGEMRGSKDLFDRRLRSAGRWTWPWSRLTRSWARRHEQRCTHGRLRRVRRRTQRARDAVAGLLATAAA